MPGASKIELSSDMATRKTTRPRQVGRSGGNVLSSRCAVMAVRAGYEVALNARCGCSADLSPGVCDRAMFHAGNGYWLPDVSILTRRLKTSTVSNTAFRGFGGPQGMIAIERVMDAIARDRGLDPLHAGVGVH